MSNDQEAREAEAEAFPRTKREERIFEWFARSGVPEAALVSIVLLVLLYLFGSESKT
jgi:hypothetical protein